MSALAFAGRTVLFDLDGTLVDSAPDLAASANEMLTRRGLQPVPFEKLRPVGGSGARGMVGVAFGLAPGQEGYEAHAQEFLDIYARRMLDASHLFDGVPALLAGLQQALRPWGIVTNKAERFALPLVEAMHLSPAAVVGGDTTPHRKPHPAPMLEALRRLNADGSHCVYVGDDIRDMHAGRAAGMATVAVRWGYLGQGEPIEAWGADAIADTPAQLMRLLDLA